MTEVVGGLRSRYIKDSLYLMVHDSLDALGWFDSGRQHVPISMRAKPVGNEEEIPLNTLVVSDDGSTEQDWELGSSMAEVQQSFWIDFYAENETIGLHMINDVRDILRGRMPSINRTASVLDVYDLSQATPPKLFTCDIDDVTVDRAHNFPKPFQRFWYACNFRVIDAYGAGTD